MAGKDIYFGRLLELLIDAIQGIAPVLSQATSDQTTALNANLSQMITKLTSTVTELQNVKSVVAQGVTAPNIKASATLKKTFTHAVKSAQPGTLDCFSFKSLGNGTVRLDLTGKSTVINASYYFYVKKAGNVILQVQPSTANVDQVCSFDNIPVEFGEEIILGMRGLSSGTMTIAANSVKAYYDLVDVVNDVAGTLSLI